MDNALILADFLTRYYHSPGYNRIRIERTLTDLKVGQMFCEIAQGFVRSLEDRLVFSANKPWPVPHRDIQVGEQVLVTAEGDPLYEHWVTFFGTDENNYPILGLRQEDAVSMGSRDFCRGRGLHEVLVNSHLTFLKFMSDLPSQIVMANPFTPIDKIPEIGDLVYLTDGPLRRRFCRVENEDEGMYTLQTLHRRENRVFSTTQEGFHILAPAGQYDNEFFQKPFLTIDEIADLVRPAAQTYVSLPLVQEKMATVWATYSNLTNLHLAEGDDLASMVSGVVEHGGDISLFINAMHGNTLEFLEKHYREKFEPWIDLFDRYKKFGEELIAKVAGRLGVAEDDLFTLNPEQGLFPGARVAVKEDPRTKGCVRWDYAPRYMGLFGAHEDHRTSFEGEDDEPMIQIDLPPYFQENGARSSQTKHFYANELTLQTRDQYLVFTEPQDLARLVTLLEYKCQGTDVNVHRLTPHLKREYGISEDLHSIQDYHPDEKFNDPLIKEAEGSELSNDIPSELSYLGFSNDELKLIYDYFFPENHWTQVCLSHSILDHSLVYRFAHLAEENQELRMRMEGLARGFRIGEIAMDPDLSASGLDHDTIHNFTNMQGMMMIGGKHSHGIEQGLEQIFGAGVHNANELSQYFERALLPGPIKWPGRVELEGASDDYATLVCFAKLDAKDLAHAILGYISNHFAARVENDRLTLPKGEIIGLGPNAEVGQWQGDEHVPFLSILYSDHTSKKPIEQEPEDNIPYLMQDLGIEVPAHLQNLLNEISVHSVLMEAEDAMGQPIQFRDKYEGQSKFDLRVVRPIEYNFFVCPPFFQGFATYVNAKNSEMRQVVGDNLALPTTQAVRALLS